MSQTSEVFCQACLNGEIEKVRSLLKDNPQLADAYGMVRPDHREFMKKEDADGGWSALHLAAHYGKLDVVEALVGAGADLNAKAKNRIANTPVMAAVAGGRKEIVRYLLEHGADPTLTDGENFTPLRLAEVEGKPEVAELIRSFRRG